MHHLKRPDFHRQDFDLEEASSDRTKDFQSWVGLRRLPYLESLVVIPDSVVLDHLVAMVMQVFMVVILVPHL